ncbi:MAG: HD domain-containing protein [Moorellaceae bacterium]
MGINGTVVPSALYTHLLDQLPIGIAFIGQEGELRQANGLARKLLAEGTLDEQSLLELRGQAGPRVFKDRTGSYFRAWCKEIAQGEEKGFLVAFIDVTSEYQLMERVRQAQEEAELALATMLPDQRIERRLKDIIEYQDEYDEASGKIKITGIIKDGVYRHVINILRLIAEATRQGLMELPGIDKNTLVTAAVFHDLAKVQPVLSIGDEVDPREVFEPGYLHAFRGAAMARGIYQLSEEICRIIQYHHTSEGELPPEFPVHLLPMYRFFRLVDGLSAGITRRYSQVTLKLCGTTLCVKEQSNFLPYNRYLELDLYAGSSIIKPL